MLAHGGHTHRSCLSGASCRSHSSAPEHVDERRSKLPSAGEIQDEFHGVVAVVQQADRGEEEIGYRVLLRGLVLEQTVSVPDEEQIRRSVADEEDGADPDQHGGRWGYLPTVVLPSSDVHLFWAHSTGSYQVNDDDDVPADDDPERDQITQASINPCPRTCYEREPVIGFNALEGHANWVVVVTCCDVSLQIEAEEKVDVTGEQNDCDG